MTDWAAMPFSEALLSPASPRAGLFAATMCASKELFANTVAFPAANRAIYMPVEVASPLTVYQFAFTFNTPTTNFDLGIYDEAGAKIVSSGSTAFGTNPQVVNVTDTLLKPGLYYLAMVADNTSVKVTGNTTLTALQLQSLGVRQQDSAFPLPSTATFAVVAANYVPFLHVSTMQATI